VQIEWPEFLKNDGDGTPLVWRNVSPSHSLRRLLLMFFCAASLVAPSASLGADLKEDTLKAWNNYLQAADAEMRSRRDGSFLWVDESPDRLQRVRNGEILVSPVGRQVPRPVSSGLIHDSIGAAFIPMAQAPRFWRDHPRECDGEFCLGAAELRVGNTIDLIANCTSRQLRRRSSQSPLGRCSSNMARRKVEIQF